MKWVEGKRAEKQLNEWDDKMRDFLSRWISMSEVSEVLEG